MSSRSLPDRALARARIPSRLAVAGLSMALLVAACGDEPGEPVAPVTASASLSGDGTDATFDWTMPARFGHDDDGDGLIDHSTPAEISPGSWAVELDACAIPGDEYTWYVDGREPVATMATCEYVHAFPAEGRYTVALEVASAGGIIRAQEVVTVQDWLILSLGDSYASGEGAPEVPAASEALAAEVLGLILDLQEAQQQLAQAQASLQAALEEKGLAQDILADAQAGLNGFLDACTIESFKDIQICASYLAGLPFSTFNAAKAHFQQAVANAQERVQDAIAAVQAAQAALAAAQSAVAGAAAAIQAAQNGFEAPRWQPKYAIEDYDEPFECHRSALAAGARAALALEAADPRTSVTFVHLACSGATMTGGRASLDAQIKWANALVGEREVDAVLVSIGGNDAGFSSLATACATQEPCFADDPVIDLANVAAACAPLSILGATGCADFFESNAPQESAKSLLEQGLAALPAAYAGIAGGSLPLLSGLREPRSGGQVIENGHPVALPDRIRMERVYLVEYADMTRDENGAYCGPTNPGDPFGAMPGFTVPEMTWLNQAGLNGINGAGAAAAQEHGWTRVTGVAAGFASRGYCAQPHWIVRVPETYLGQGDMNGMAHPNRAGHQFTGEVIAAALADDLYLDGPDAPRPPDQPQVQLLAGGGR